jgi:hypothetical protein
MNTTRSLIGRARAYLCTPANYASLLLVAAAALATACGSSMRDDLFGGSAEETPRPHGTGGKSGHGVASGGGGVSGASAAGAGNSGEGGGSSGGLGSGGVGAGGDPGGPGSAGGIAGAGAADAGTGSGPGADGAGGDPGAGGANAGGTPGSGGGGDGSGGAGGAPERPPCVTKPSQIVMIGDSYVNWTTHTFGADLAKEAGETWRMYAMGGASMATGGIATLIPDQFESGIRADKDIRVAVMDGGGNDILVPAATWVGGGNCKNRADSGNVAVCQKIVQASLDREQELFERMADVGVRDVVFFFYPIVPNNTLLGGTNPNAIAIWALPKVKTGCDDAYARTGGRLRCHFVDMVPVFKDHPDYFATGDIHPNRSGSAAMAEAVWDTMTSACVAQKPSSGCCEP